MMRRTIKALTVVGTLGVLGACDSYFSGPGIDTNPNVPSQAAADQLFVGFQGFSTANMTGDNNRVISLFTQQMAGTGRQWAGYDQYSITENDFQWDSYYNGGGLVDLRKVQDQVKGDKLYLGIAQVWEALIVGQLADMWGDIPYSDALGASSTPTLDKQADVYAKLQTLLDNAITNLNAGGNGPGAADLVFGGAKAPWLQVARTLKARLYMHTAESDATAYAKALTETGSGISSAANDFTTYQSGTTGEQNQWFQFRIQRGTDISAGALLVNLMKSRNDPRLTDYFGAGPAAGGVIIGAEPGEEDDGTFAWLSDGRGSPDFRQPIVTFAENQLIRAEAQYKTGATAAALQTLNAFRATVGLPALNVSGSALYTAIMEEKYVSLFQNVEVWNDYKRTCYPNLTPVTGTTIPARFLYGASERNSNPNIPSPSQQPRRNTNDPRTTTSTDGSACKGQ
ncbi:MAG: SusD/RagB family nutrient-binding outer membrane lipoprotein [Gemmatimonadaceae bacterium]